MKNLSLGIFRDIHFVFIIVYIPLRFNISYKSNNIWFSHIHIISIMVILFFYLVWTARIVLILFRFFCYYHCYHYRILYNINKSGLNRMESYGFYLAVYGWMKKKKKNKNQSKKNDHQSTWRSSSTTTSMESRNNRIPKKK